MNQAVRIVALLCGLGLLGAAWATDDDPDEDLLIFLGSWDDDVDEWQEFFDSLPPELAEGDTNDDTNDRSTKSDSD